MSSDSEDLLALLNAHGQQFMSSFATSTTALKKRKGAPTAAERSAKRARSEGSESQEEAWTGFGVGADSDLDDEDEEDQEDEDDSEGDEDLIEGTYLISCSTTREILSGTTIDDGYTAGGSALQQPEVVVFNGPNTSRSAIVSKTRAKMFMVNWSFYS